MKDIILFSANDVQNLKNVDEDMGLLQKAGVTMEMGKCILFKQNKDYLAN